MNIFREREENLREKAGSVSQSNWKHRITQ